MPDSGPTPSIAARLRQQYGREMDPRIDLEPDAESRQAPPTSSRPTDSAAPSSARLQSLGDRSVAASRYQLRGEIARGGMGAILEVFDEDLRRRLAMKVILDRRSGSTAGASGAVDPVALARFLEEAQVTGQLDHPGVVPVHELGIDEQGRVYFTMRLVHGRDLEAICTLAARGEEDWSVTRVLGVLLKVCEAMAYAHQKGVVHRDLKPQNVMVGRFGEVYVMDWGLARVRNATDHRDLRLRAAGQAPGATVATDRSEAAEVGDGAGLRTMDGDIVGTPSYMSPEQARGDLAAIDERSDVYSVGAMLYRLLAGAAPYGDARTDASVVWQRVMGGPPVAIEKLAPTAPPELCAICAKAMARDPADRYRGMLDLATDLRAFLEGRVVAAFETGALAEARKWIARNRGFAVALAAAVVALVAGLFGSLVFAGRARDNAVIAEERRNEAARSAELAEQRRQEAVASAAAAQHQARIAQEVNSFLNDDVLAAMAPEHDGKDVTVRQVLDRASLRIDLAGIGGGPQVEAALRMTMGTSYERLGENELARKHFERALSLAREHIGERSEPTFKALRGYAMTLTRLGRHQEAIECYRQALPIARELLGPEHRGTLSTIGDLSSELAAVGQFDEARQLREESLAVQARVLGEDAEDTLTARNNLALLDRTSGRFVAAERSLRDVFERRQAKLGKRHPDTLVVMNNLALTLADLGRLDEGEALAREVLAEYREMFDEDHPKVASAVCNVGTFVFKRGRLPEAEQLFQEALRLYLLRSAADAPEVLRVKHNLAASIDDPRRRDEVLALRREVADTRRRLFGAQHRETLEATSGLAGALREANRLDEAEALYRETLAARRDVLGDDHPDTIQTLEFLGGVLVAKGDHAGSETLTREVLERRRRVLGDSHPDVANTTLNLAVVLRLRGSADALQVIEDALARSRAAFGDSHPQVALALRTLGDIRNDAKQHADAVAAYRQALDIRRRLRSDDALVAYLLHQIAYQLLQTEELDAALQHATEAAALRQSLYGADWEGARRSSVLRARILVAMGRHAEAEPLLLDQFERAKRIDGADAELTKLIRGRLVSLYESWNRPDEAARWR